MKNQKIRTEVDRAKNIILDSFKEITDKTLPILFQTFSRIISGFLNSMEESIKSDLVKKIEKEKTKTEQEKNDGNSK
jgi:ribosomal protein L11 methylase PrmA